MAGGHLLKSWSAIQKSVTLSSGEAELVAALKMATELLGLCRLAGDGMGREGLSIYGLQHGNRNGQQAREWQNEARSRGHVMDPRTGGGWNP